MKIQTPFFLLIVFLIGIGFVSMEQNYIPYLKSDNRYVIFNTLDSSFDLSNGFFDEAELSTIEKFIYLGRNNGDSTKWGLLNSETGKLILPVNFDDILIRNEKFIVATKTKEITKERIMKTLRDNSSFFVETSKITNYLTVYDLYGRELYYDENADFDGITFYDVDIENRLSSKNPFKPFMVLRTKFGFKVLNKDFKLIFEKNNITILNYLGNDLFQFSYDNKYVQKKKYGLIDISGEIIVEPLYSSLYMGDNGLISAEKFTYYNQKSGDKKFGYLNLKGEPVIPFKYNFIWNFSDGIAIVSNLPVSQNKFQIINTQGNIIQNNVFRDTDKVRWGIDQVHWNLTSLGKFIVCKKNGKNYLWNIIDKSRNLMFKGNYELLQVIEDNLIFVKDLNGALKFIDSKEQVIFTFPSNSHDFGQRFNGKSKIIYYLNNKSKYWQLFDLNLKSFIKANFDSTNYIYDISNNVICFKNGDGSGIKCHDFNGKKLFALPEELSLPRENLLSSTSFNDGENNYELNKFNRKFLVYSQTIKEGENYKNIWYDFKSDIKYVDN